MNKRVEDRVKRGLGHFRGILESARDRDVSESDTVHLVHDMLAEVFGWDKYSELTTEFEIRGTYCDLAIKHEGKLKYLLEVKAINNNLKENHVRQAVGYAASEGTEWVVLTNGIEWQAYQVKFEQPVRAEMVFEFNILDRDAPKDELMAKLFTICKEAVKKEAIEEFAARRQLLNKYTLTSILTSPTLLGVIRREVRRLKKGISVSTDEIKKILEADVIKRELIESDKAKEAMMRVRRSAGRRSRTSQRKKKDETEETPSTPEEPRLD